MNPCSLCPHRCGVNRLAGQTGKCRTAIEFSIASHTLHFGEEPVISGTHGSGTIFFSHCTLSCAFCQNYPISQLGNGNPVSIDGLAALMLELQKKGAHNINFVTPTHVTPQIVEAVAQARAQGLTVPLVYNCSGYEEVETLQLLEGIIDIYLPDAKYSNDAHAVEFSGAEHYMESNRKALKEMYRQVGNLVTDENDIAVKGLIIRHLVLPNDLAGSKEVLEFIAEELSPDIALSLMAQYHPAHRIEQFPELSRRINKREYQSVLKIARKLNLENGWKQEL